MSVQGFQPGFVRFEGVSKSYDGVSLIVEDLDLSIAKGEFLTMLGPSGSGKTTSLMMLAGFEQATSGEIYLDDVPLSLTPAHRRGIGMVFQNYALFPHMTVAENLAFPLEVRKMTKADTQRLVLRALETVQLSHLRDRKPAQLSGGQQQRVALARALIFEPTIVLMDEPLGALDKQLREHMQREIRALHRSLGITMVYVTHDQSEALTMSDRVAVFGSGKIQQLASPEQLYETPSNAFVASFIGENNTIAGELVEWGAQLSNVKLRNGAVVTVRTGDLISSDRNAIISVRPERVVVRPAVNDDTIVLQAECTDLIYHGDHIRVCFDDKALGAVVAKIPNARAYELPAVGDVVPIGWNRRDAIGLKQGL
ncbi:ABC transporter ATP-binding protein [Agrobacterium rhizogenes]|uniref:ABC transporter ATP-binding protein n=1 Tax=Rhizobium rhizogenes TaxID=359 RepID=UPI0022B71846|nr:ABC transporter ATP-binding protein [Rhizobium rhizogenes]MCZ7450885.1 ABC transporter ATP-binding protein [Rhizobium rhizogenes]